MKMNPQIQLGCVLGAYPLEKCMLKAAALKLTARMGRKDVAVVGSRDDFLL